MNYLTFILAYVIYSKLSSNPEQEPHPQPPPISKVYPFLPPAAGGLRGVRGGGYELIINW